MPAPSGGGRSVLAAGGGSDRGRVDIVDRHTGPSASLGILRLARDFSPEQLETACARALSLKSTSYRIVRGSSYYH